MATASTELKNEDPAPRHKPSEQLPSLRGPRLPYHPLIEDRFGIDKASWKALVEAIFPTATSVESVVLALSYCKARKLDPFKRNVHIVPIWNNDAKCYVDTIWPGIGELRTTAFRTGDYAGRGDSLHGPMRKEKVGTVEMEFPEWAQVTVKRLVKGHIVDFVGPRVYWLETYAVRSRNDDSPNEMWATRPIGQIDKCFDENTEVLTDAGFQPFGCVTGRIMQVGDNGLEVTDAVPFSQAYSGLMVTCDGNGLNFCVTPNHDLLTTSGKVEAQILYDHSTSSAGATIPLSVSGTTADRQGISDDQLVLAAAIVCDGSKFHNGFAISVSRRKKIRELERINLHFSQHTRACAGDRAVIGTRVITTLANKEVFSYRRNATVGLNRETGDLEPSFVLTLSRRQARVLVDAMIQFDGSTGKTYRRFYSSYPEVLGMFELAACIGGYSVSRRRERRSPGSGSNWIVTVSTKEQAKTFRSSPSQTRLRGGLRLAANTGGYVWCCRVPTGVIVVRRSGLSMLCGNCAEAAALRAAFPEEIGSDFIPEEVQAKARSIPGTFVDAPENTASSGKLDALTERLTVSTEEPVKEKSEEVGVDSLFTLDQFRAGMSPTTSLAEAELYYTHWFGPDAPQAWSLDDCTAAAKILSDHQAAIRDARSAKANAK